MIRNMIRNYLLINRVGLYNFETFLHFESPGVRTALFCLHYTDRIVHFWRSDQNWRERENRPFNQLKNYTQYLRAPSGVD